QMPISVVFVIEASTRRIGIHYAHFYHGLPRRLPSVGVHIARKRILPSVKFIINCHGDREPWTRRVARLRDEANWKSLWSIVENIFLPRVEFKYSPTNGPVIHSKRDGLTATPIQRLLEVWDVRQVTVEECGRSLIGTTADSSTISSLGNCARMVSAT